MYFLQSYYTDIGIKRKTNQDSLALFKADTDKGEVLLGIVCDGMGGYQSGELASKVIVESFEKWFKLELPKLIYKKFYSSTVVNQWTSIINSCNEKLVSYGRSKKIEMGSTLTAVLCFEDKYYIAHVGDSRAYMILDNDVNQLTLDQSLVAEALRNGEITKEEATKDKRRNVLTECIGITSTVAPLFFEGKLEGKESILICSDGFWHNLSEDEMERYLSSSQFENNKMIRMHLNYLVELDKQRLEKDNISAVCIIPRKETD